MEFMSSQEEGKDIEELCELRVVCTKFLLTQNVKPNAVDLLEELEFIEKLTELVNENIYARVCQYMIR